MIDDIVTRLRNLYSPFPPFVRDDEVERAEIVIEEAADEIERLRNALEQCIAERDTWRNLYHKERMIGEIGDDRILHEPAGEIPEGKTRRL